MKRSSLHKAGSKAARTNGFKKLVKGVHKFQLEHFGENRILFEKLAHGQKPQSLFITCADSRIDPNLITGSKPGDLFVMRNIANLVPKYDSSTSTEAGAVIEYAVSVLGVSEIIVMGHSDCGGIKAVLHPEKLNTLPAVSDWLTHAAPASEDCCAFSEEVVELDEITRNNVLLQITHLVAYPKVAEAVENGKLRIHGWIYEIETGSISYFDQARKGWCKL